MAQAAKQLKKIKDIEAQALQEQKEKEESDRKRRNRSRDRKKKVRGGGGGSPAAEAPCGGRRWQGLGRPGARGPPAELVPPGLEGAGARGGEGLQCCREGDWAGGWKGRAGGQEAKDAQEPARPPPAETFQHLGQMPQTCSAPGATFPAPRRTRVLGGSAGSPPLWLSKEAGLDKGGSGLRRLLCHAPPPVTHSPAQRASFPGP